MSTHPPARGGLAAALAGAACLPRGIGLFLRTPGVRLLGILPVLLAGAVVLALLVTLLFSADDLARWLTPFAERWSGGARLLARLAVALVLLTGFAVLAVLSFATLTSVIGQPFYEEVCDRVEALLGDPPPGASTPWWRTFPRATVESVALLALVLTVSGALLALSLVPVLGQTVAPAVGWAVSGFFLALELLSIPLQRRGLGLRGRLRFLWRHRAATLGFGVTAFALFLVPFMNLLAMPGALVGGILLVRWLSSTPAAQGARERRHDPLG